MPVGSQFHSTSQLGALHVFFLSLYVEHSTVRQKTNPQLTYDFFLPFMAGQTLEQLREATWQTWSRTLFSDRFWDEFSDFSRVVASGNLLLDTLWDDD